MFLFYQSTIYQNLSRRKIQLSFEWLPWYLTAHQPLEQAQSVFSHRNKMPCIEKRWITVFMLCPGLPFSTDLDAYFSFPSSESQRPCVSKTPIAIPKMNTALILYRGRTGFRSHFYCLLPVWPCYASCSVFCLLFLFCFLLPQPEFVHL